MGQYHVIANLDRKEYLHPHRLGLGLKQAEQVGCAWSTGDLLALLVAGTGESRGGGDFADTSGFIGRWGGDRVVFVGDYAHDGDFEVREGDPAPSQLYSACRDADEDWPGAPERFKDISDLAVAWMNAEPWCDVRVDISSEGWRSRSDKEVAA
jgi:hypothetical protein